MNLDSLNGRRSVSPASSGRASPVQRASRRQAEEGGYKTDKSLRRYAAGIERALASFESPQHEWADYIAFLGRLLKAIQLHPPDVPVLPHSASIASRLAQCLNPALPSGVHQKALEVYSYIFSLIGRPQLSTHMHEYLPGLSTVLSFASLTVRPGLYALFEKHLIKLPLHVLRPALKSLILSLLPALEEEGSEDFDRAFAIVDSLRSKFENPDSEGIRPDGFFWQCLFLAVITSPSRRQGALNFLGRRLPKFTAIPLTTSDASNVVDSDDEVIDPAAEAVISPEPGLLVRCFASGLTDPQMLIQRGFLDLLVTHLPLQSPVLQARISEADMDCLVSAAVVVVLRRDMSLNRRLWSWFLGPEEVNDNAEDDQVASPVAGSDEHHGTSRDTQAGYFGRFGRRHLTRSILVMVQKPAATPADRARPLRICLSLMDRHEIGGTLVPNVFLPAMESVYEYTLNASTIESAEVLRSASLFFDGVESHLIWSKLVSLFKSVTGNTDFLMYVFNHFNIKDEEMRNLHIPLVAVYAMERLIDVGSETMSADSNGLLRIAICLVNLIPRDISVPGSETASVAQLPPLSDTGEEIEAFYGLDSGSRLHNQPPLNVNQALTSVVRQATKLAQRSFLGAASDQACGIVVEILIAAIQKLPILDDVLESELKALLTEVLTPQGDEITTVPFAPLSAMISLIHALITTDSANSSISTDELLILQPAITGRLWSALSPSRPEYHVEAVRMIWQMEALTAPVQAVEATLASYLRSSDGPDPTTSNVEAIRRFTVLWTHTIPTQPVRPASRSGIIGRRASSMLGHSDLPKDLAYEEILTRPLLLVLDTLCDQDSEAFDVVRTWLRELPSIDQVLRTLLSHVTSPVARTSTSNVTRKSKQARQQIHGYRDLTYYFQHTDNVLRHGSSLVWSALGNLEVVDVSSDTLRSIQGHLALAEACMRTITSSDPDCPLKLRRSVVSVLQQILDSPLAISMKNLGTENTLIGQLIRSLHGPTSCIQGSLLNLLTMALKLRLAPEQTTDAEDATRRYSMSVTRPSVSARGGAQLPTPALKIPAPAQLLDCLRAGFSSTSSRWYLELWVTFLAEILPMFDDAIFTSLIPLVECFCGQLSSTFQQLQLIMSGATNEQCVAPETSLAALLTALELVLAKAHDRLRSEAALDAAPKPAEEKQGFFGNMVSGVFTVDGPPSRTARANSYLTVILAFQDAIRISFSIWTWSTSNTEAARADQKSSASLAYNALKLRNKTRRLLEHLFAAEPLECLETLIVTWCKEAEATAVFSLLHVMDGSRPRSIVPVILNALYSRTNPTGIPTGRTSSLTSDLTPIDVIAFLIAYLKTVDDDAMDEIWSDCMVFLRDVLSNPLPQRQVLPALLEITALLAEKIDNTNFGEQKRMRRELGDLFLRLLSATFTTTPLGSITETPGSLPNGSERSTSYQVNPHTFNLVNVLARLAPNLQLVLESNDRITSAVNTIVNSAVGPTFRARAFPENVSAELLGLLLQIMKQSPSAKTWRKEVTDVFNDPRLLMARPDIVCTHWFPVLRQWSLGDKERIPELLSRIAAPSSAGIMFGVGASAARLDADRKTQMNLRRTTLLLLSGTEDMFTPSLALIDEKIVELAVASPSSSPSSAIWAELFMLLRAIVLSTSAIHLASLWQLVNDSLQSALTSILPGSMEPEKYSNLSLLQACKLLDLLIITSPDEFQLHEWLYITDTIDAVYQPDDWQPAALSDQIAEELGTDSTGIPEEALPSKSTAHTGSGRRQPLLHSPSIDKEDIKAMAKHDFARTMLRPFLNQLSIHAYEAVYSLTSIDLEACRQDLLEDVLDQGTIIS